MSAVATVITVLEGRQMLHGIVTHGGAAPDIAPANTSALHYPRVPDVESLQQLEARIRACFEAGGLATGCAHEVTQVAPVCTDLVSDPWLAAACRAAITGLGRSPLSPEDERDRPTGGTDMGNVTRALPVIRQIGRVSRRHGAPAISDGGEL